MNCAAFFDCNQCAILQLIIQAFVAEGAVEALNVGIIYWFARPDKIKLHPPIPIFFLFIILKFSRT